MKKIYLLAAIVMASTAISAMAQTGEPELNWAKCIYYGNATSSDKVFNIGTNVAVNNDGDIFYSFAIGTNTGTQEVYLGDGTTGDFLGNGCAYYSGTSCNHNLAVVKMSPDGNMKWKLYFPTGEVATQQGGVVPASDGGCFLVMKMRHSQNYCTTPIMAVDASGDTIKFDDWVLDAADAKRYYYGVIMRVDATGHLLWHRYIRMNHDGQPTATTYADNTGEAFYINAVKSDESDNVYVIGRYVTAMTLDNGVTLYPQSTEGWNGDPQTSRGDAIMLKFDSNGNNVGHLTMDGVATVTMFKEFDRGDDGNFYITGTLNGIEGNTLTLGGKTLDFGADQTNLMVASVTPDLTVNYVKVFKATYSNKTPGVNELVINACGDDLWITGKAGVTSGNWLVRTDNGTDTAFIISKTRDGFVMKLDRATGSFLAATVNNAIQSGYDGAFVSDEDPDSVYVYGMSGLYGNLIFKKFNKNTLEAGSTWAIHAKVAATQGFATDGDRLYTLSRIQRGTQTINYDSSASAPRRASVTNSVSSFYTVITSYTMPVAATTAVEDITADVAQRTVKNVSYVNLMGQRSATPFEGLNIVVTTYTDGTTSTTKVLK